MTVVSPSQRCSAFSCGASVSFNFAIFLISASKLEAAGVLCSLSLPFPRLAGSSTSRLLVESNDGLVSVESSFLSMGVVREVAWEVPEVALEGLSIEVELDSSRSGGASLVRDFECRLRLLIFVLTLSLLTSVDGVRVGNLISSTTSLGASASEGSSGADAATTFLCTGTADGREVVGPSDRKSSRSIKPSRLLSFVRSLGRGLRFGCGFKAL